MEQKFLTNERNRKNHMKGVINKQEERERKAKKVRENVELEGSIVHVDETYSSEGNSEGKFWDHAWSNIHFDNSSHFAWVACEMSGCMTLAKATCFLESPPNSNPKNVFDKKIAPCLPRGKSIPESVQIRCEQDNVQFWMRQLCDVLNSLTRWRLGWWATRREVWYTGWRFHRWILWKQRR